MKMMQKKVKCLKGYRSTTMPPRATSFLSTTAAACTHSKNEQQKTNGSRASLKGAPKLVSGERFYVYQYDSMRMTQYVVQRTAGAVSIRGAPSPSRCGTCTLGAAL